MDRLIRVLLIENEANDAHLIRVTLENTVDIHFDMVLTETLLQTQELLFVDTNFDVILLGFASHEYAELEVLQFMRQITTEIPIIILSNFNNTEFALTALEIGALDYISKDIFTSYSDGLARVIRYAITRVELEKSNQLLKKANLNLNLFHTLNKAAIICETDLNGKILFVNGQFRFISGYSNKELLWQSHKILSSGAHDKDFYLNLWSMIKQGKIWTGEICNRKKSGELYWVQAIILPVFQKDAQEGHYRYGLVGLDVTEKKKHELAMQNRAALYEAAIETTDGFCRISNVGKFLDVSEGYCSLSGYCREELLTMNILKMTGNFALTLEQFSRIVRGHGKTFEIEQHRKDGSVWLAEVTASYCNLNDGSLFVFLRDITEQAEMQNREKILRAQITQMQKIDSIGKLTAGIGHDFNNMLNGILGYTELSREIIKEEVTDECLRYELEHNLSRAVESGKRAMELIAKMMDYCRQPLERQSIENIEVKKTTTEIIHEVVGMVQAGLTKKFKIEVTLNQTPHLFIADIDLHQILTNLLINARDAMKPKGGIIKVKLASVTLLTYQCAACLMPIEGDLIELSVSDSGMGIDKKIIENIFDPFFTTKKEGEGTGLGLSTVSGIVHHAHGHILVDSKIGSGTTFKLLFKIG